MIKLSVTGLGKAYKIYTNRFSRIKEWLSPSKKKYHSKKWILEDISFELKAGEALGILGVNGAGKSTLLKLITGTIRPSTGSINFTGKISALLELGMGFHPDFTGRQNVFLAAQLLGLDNAQINQLFPEIEAFAEIGSYIDEPLRVYSSGMQVRLAFSVAVAVRPDILIIDEALSVGDIYFQQKCLAKISQYKALGTAILFVTHDISTLHAVCDRALLISDGRLAFEGLTPDAVELYYGYLNRDKAVSASNDFADVIDGSSTFTDLSYHLSSLSLRDGQDKEVQFLYEGADYQIVMSFKNLNKYKDPHIGFRIQDNLGNVMYETNTYCQKIYLSECVSPQGEVEVRVKFNNNFPVGKYTIAIGIEAEAFGEGFFEKVICLTKRVMDFDVLRDSSEPKWAGKANVYPSFHMNSFTQK